MNELKDYWEVTLDKEGGWHCFHRYHPETPYEATHLAPQWLARWIIPAPTRGQAITIAKRDWRQIQAEDVRLAEAGMEDYARGLAEIDSSVRR